MSPILNSPNPSNRSADGKPPRKPLTLGLVRGIVVATAAGGVFAFMGAFGTGAAPFGLRLAYWVPVMLAGAVWGHLCSRLIERWIDLDERPWLTVAALTAAITGPVSVLVWAVTGLIFEGRLYPLSALPWMLVPVGVVTAALSAINVFLSKAQPVQTHAAAVGAAPARFLDRLPQAEGRGDPGRPVRGPLSAHPHRPRLGPDPDAAVRRPGPSWRGWRAPRPTAAGGSPATPSAT
jgi:hypothetical protein